MKKILVTLKIVVYLHPTLNVFTAFGIVNEFQSLNVKTVHAEPSEAARFNKAGIGWEERESLYYIERRLLNACS